ncbi:type I-C CRISPR-associated protein Cas7/Csd2 [Tetragenococcus halophilus]|uniref:type I-C CRISPR-associated protein Cas7/Csd2 n=1 Tax=Tetragenococcus halophilus TaxID=51669 RepID=UPI00083D8F60|nr:type I-C CRISPR-associated protein Cas7/Csd2 [Tetragenococcus halophilus]AOF48335.1 CRISPR-associated protein [Tetragenococcus halophilus]MCO8294368.1 type I-C CRISPR-associated protein Cas7/Csd2 [Tetragenococcus halophilus]GFK21322.1 CRISPR-associated protein [Tetragenococcus halophilus]
MLTNKVDFIATIEVNNANPNGDPLAGNMPRTDSNGYGLISDVAIKRKIRNRMQDQGNDIFVKSRDHADDGFNSLQKRFENEFGKESDEEVENKSNENWLDVRSFGQVITYQNRSIGIRGPISVSMAKSLDPIEITSMQITRSANSMEPKGTSSRSSDTMGTKHFVEYGVYVVFGSANVFFSEKTGFSEDDLKVIKESLLTLFANDASSARPEGSMAVKELFWFIHSNKLGNVSSAKIHELLEYDRSTMEHTNYEDYQIKLNQEKLAEYKDKGLQVEIIEGL